MENLKKPFMTVEEQIDKLEGRGLSVVDRKSTYDKLLHNNYYTVINGYKLPFLAQKSEKASDQDAKDIDEKYIEGASFDELFALYLFDCNLRALLLKYILKIEHQLKSVISHCFAKNHKDERYPDYLKSENFDVDLNKEVKGKKEKQYESFCKHINEEFDRQIANSNEMLIHYQEKYGNIPPWILVSIFSFGILRAFYYCLSNKEQNEISRFFGLKPDELNSYLAALNIYRNACAHDERVYNLKLKSKVIRKNEIGTKLEYNKVYVVILILKDMLDASSFMTFYSEFDDYVNELKRNLHSIRIEDILHQMGIPADEAVRKAELGQLVKGTALSNKEFEDILKRYIIPMLPIDSELQEVMPDDENKDNRACRIVELKGDVLYFAQSASSEFDYCISLNNSAIAQLQIENVQEHLKTLIDYIHVFWNLSNLSAYGRDKVAIAFPTLCEQAYELTICNLMCKKRSRSAAAVYDEAFEQYKRTVGAASEEERKQSKADMQQKKNEANKIVEQESIAEKTLYSILTQIELWANKTYEGQKKTFGIVFSKDMMPLDEESFDYVEFLKNDYSATINDGIYSAVELFSNGFFKRHLTIYSCAGDDLPSIPYPFSGFAKLCTEDKIGILLTESGDILIINNEKLCYTKHNGHWVQCMADKIIEQIKRELKFETSEKAVAIYQAIVDVSFSRGGACIGIINGDQLPEELRSMIKAGLLQDNAEDHKLMALKRMISVFENSTYRQKNFFELDRALRRELLELDGAMVLSNSGLIHVIGTIIKLDGSGSDGGGRTAAAVQLSKFGLSIKISQDGYVQLFKNEEVIMEIMT